MRQRYQKISALLLLSAALCMGMSVGTAAEENVEAAEYETTAVQETEAGAEAEENVEAAEYEAAGSESAEADTEETVESERAGKEDTMVTPITELVDSYLAGRAELGENWAVSIEDLTTGEVYNYNAAVQQQSASVIKVFIMGAVYERLLYPTSDEMAIPYSGDSSTLRSLVESMITVSDNECANRLVELLGQEDFEKGAEVVNQFCADHGFDEVHLGRRFLAVDPADDNYISAGDCRAILSDIYHRRLVNEMASEMMQEYLNRQERTWKIPAGLPADYTSGNKTGEVYGDNGLGYIENDMALVYSPYGDYVLAIASSNLDGRNDEADQVIQKISADVAQWFAEKHA
ncbi:MAG: serine hydrolase [Eubacteriales bacterium]|nr:serine hydrolase [Eubacteriales bacterium]